MLFELRFWRCAVPKRCRLCNVELGIDVCRGSVLDAVGQRKRRGGQHERLTYERQRRYEQHHRGRRHQQLRRHLEHHLGEHELPGSESGSESSVGGGDCIPDEITETSCDSIDNDCDGFVDNVDAALDGFCDCLRVGILGDTGYNPTANFVSWLQEQGTSVTRTTLAGNPDVVTPELLANYDVLLIDRIERALSPEEAAAIEDFVKNGGSGLITLIGYNFDNDNPAPERDRANSVLDVFGLGYTGGYLHADANVTPTFDDDHPVSMGISDVNYAGGIAPVDNGAEGESAIFATVPQGDAGLAHQTADDGGRVIVWGDEWITFDSDWVGYADVQQFWAQMLAWVRPDDICFPPQG